jgi:hypothetical protein
VEVGKYIREPERGGPAPPSFAEAALSGENQRRREETFARPARQKFKRHVAIFCLGNLLLGATNFVFFPEHIAFYILTIVWTFVLADNFVWAYVVDPDRDIAERKARRAERATMMEALTSDQAEVRRHGPGSTR